jgi:hypothetical protein
MIVPFASRRALLVFTLAALPFLAGSSCAVFWSSGNGSSNEDDQKKDDEGFIVVVTGNFGDPPVSSGTTGENGEFEYEPGKSVQFFIGDINLGPPVTAKPDMSPEDLVAGGVREATAGTNIRRLLQSLDADPEDATITIPAEVRAAAVMANADVAPAIQYLDFTDDAVFVNTASQLVAALTRDYPFTATLVAFGDVPQQLTRAVARE